MAPTLALRTLSARFCSKFDEYAHLPRFRPKRFVGWWQTSGGHRKCVANGFFGSGWSEVDYSFPKGKVSENFRKSSLQLWDKIITCTEVDWCFDDCQKLVEEAFLEQDLNRKLCLTSAEFN